MALINFTGFESGGATEAFATGGTISYSTSIAHTGSYALRVNPTTTALGWYQINGIGTDGQTGNTSGYLPASATNTLGFSFWIYVATRPGGSGVEPGEEIMSMDAAGADGASVRLNPDGTLGVYNSSITLVGTSSTALSSNTWHHISGTILANNTPSGHFTLKINGTTEVNVTASFGSYSGTLQGKFFLGKHNDQNSQTMDIYLDDLVLDTATEPSGVVQISHPSANGTTMQWTSGTAPSDYTTVDEVVPSTTDYVMNPLTASRVALFSVQSMSTVGISGESFLAVKAMTQKFESISGTSSDKTRTVSGSTTVDTVAVNHTTTPTLVSQLLVTDPATTAPWTETAINNLQIGAIETNAFAVRMSWVALGILYTAGTTPSGMAASDSVTVSESVSARPETSANKSENVSVTESLSVVRISTGVPSVTVADTVTTSETVTATQVAATTLSVSVSDSVTVSESASVAVTGSTPTVLVSDSATLSESVSMLIQTFFVNVSDSITVTETKFLSSNAIPITVSDSVSVTDDPVVGGPYTDTRSISVSDTVTITESRVFLITGKIAVSDTVTVTESKTAALVAANTPAVTKSETVTVSESVTVRIPTLFLEVSDTVTVTEFLYALGPSTLPAAPIPPRQTQPFSGGQRRIAHTRIEILDSDLNLVTWVKSPIPLNRSGTILRYSKELSDFGTCTFRISSYDPSFSTLGDIVAPHTYHVRITRDGVIVWQGAIIENTKRNRDFIEVVAAEYTWYLGKKLVNRSSNNPTTGVADGVYRIFDTGTMDTVVTTIMNETINAFQSSNHALASLSLGTVENPNYPPNMTNANGTALSGPWSFGDGIAAPRLTYDFHSLLYILKSFGAYTYADFNIDSGLQFNFKKFLGNDHHYDLTFRWGQQGNIRDFNVIRLGERMVNHLWGIAIDNDGKILHHDKTDEPSIHTSGILEQVVAYADIKDQGSLNARIDAELPLISTSNAAAISVTLDQRSHPLGVYDIGDIVTIIVDHTAVQYNQIRRIVGITVDVESTGLEVPTLQLNVPRPFQYGAA